MVKGCEDCCDTVDTTVSVLESCKQVLDNHHQVDALCFVLRA